MYRIVRCTEDDYRTLAGIWERSVHATHLFLNEEDIEEIKSALIPEYFPNVDLYAASDGTVVAGFIGQRSDVVEMLFIDSPYRGEGYGSLLIDFAKEKGATKVDVNEQNPSALGFYVAKGFRIIGRDDRDDAGRPYPILHMSL